MRKYIR